MPLSESASQNLEPRTFIRDHVFENGANCACSFIYEFAVLGGAQRVGKLGDRGLAYEDEK